MEPIINLRNKCKGADCKKICKSIYEFLYETKVPIRVSELCGKLNDMGLTYQAKEQKRIWDILMSVHFRNRRSYDNERISPFIYSGY